MNGEREKGGVERGEGGEVRWEGERGVERREGKAERLDEWGEGEGGEGGEVRWEEDRERGGVKRGEGGEVRWEEDRERVGVERREGKAERLDEWGEGERGGEEGGRWRG